ncbi:MAG: hypothetical protein DMG57_18125 [Acidobacteria bacterium]|nr:MAG: hypothetical protein DMG57_18125 [Acidobacteriota bacterium]
MYAKNATGGQWKAHGRYIARESASQGPAAEAGFDATERGINIVARLDQWQSAGDERLWKLILSPEFGDKMDLIRLTRDLTKRMARDLDTRLEWVAVAHFNTDNPHVHIALRGICEDGRPLRLERDYVKHGIRSIAEDLCTLQLGYRTQSDVAQAQRREVSQQRFTSLDRAIARDKPIDGQSSHFPVSRNPAQLKNQYVIARLRTLESMGLAEAAGADQWLVRQDLETALRAMQRLGDRQKILAAHGVLVSDTRLPLAMFDLRNCTTLEGRILVHGEDEAYHRAPPGRLDVARSSVAACACGRLSSPSLCARGVSGLPSCCWSARTLSAATRTGGACSRAEQRGWRGPVGPSPRSKNSSHGTDRNCGPASRRLP